MRFLEYLRTRTEDVDVYVDGVDGIAFCPESFRLTNAGVEKFKPVFDMEMDGDTVIGNDDDYDDLCDYEENGNGDGGRLYLAWELLCAMAGYCSVKNHREWFNEI